MEIHSLYIIQYFMVIVKINLQKNSVKPWILVGQKCIFQKRIIGFPPSFLITLDLFIIPLYNVYIF